MVKKTVLLMLAMALLPACLFAVDGVVLINQSTVVAAGGFPYVISQPGSYKLTGNLTPPVDTSAIKIASNDVAVDLNGFAIIGNSSGAFGNNTAIVDVGSRTRIAIRNGSITAFNLAIDLRNSSHMIIEQMNLNARIGNFTGTSLIAGNLVSSSAIIGGNISVGLLSSSCPARIADNVSTAYSLNDIGAGACVSSNNAMAP